MATPSLPPIPPRPTRTHAQAQKPASTTAGGTSGSELPKIPPRPTNRHINRSISPHRESFARSPLNEPHFMVSHKPATNLSDNGHISVSDTPQRPSSIVNMPSIGQEGMEYADLCISNKGDLTPNETRNVAEDLRLYAPMPSLPISSAKERISSITRTDSSQAAAMGLGKSTENKLPSDDKDPQDRTLKGKASFASSISNGLDRAIDNEDQPDGPEAGQRVPMYPNAGLVQAPSPSPFSQFPPGIGYHNDGSKHRQRPSARGFEGPPGSYGMHGHGITPKDKFEQAYYEKRPELWKKEISTYGEEWQDSAMSSDDLNKIVRQTASRGSGLGSPAPIGTPTEQIGYVASEEYISRMSSSRPGSIIQHNKVPSNASDALPESGLTMESSTASDKAGTADSLGRSFQRASETALESEVEEEDVVHVDEPSRRISRIYGGAKHADSTENLGPTGGNTPDAGGFIVESGYGVPILASDEVAKEPFGYELQAAVSPQRDDNYNDEHSRHSRTGSASNLYNSRPSSRPASIHRDVPNIAYQGEFDRDAHSTPLDDVEEYEPLFPEDEKSQLSKQKLQTHADKLKSRPELKGRRFPSQDIWEDAPDSHMQTATVSTPQLPEEPEESNPLDQLHIRKGETSEQASTRRQEELTDNRFRSEDSESFLKKDKGKHPWEQNQSLVGQTEPETKQRFPSRDVWEDSPDSLLLQATVYAPQSEESSISEERPTTDTAIYHQEKQAAGIPLGHEEGRATTGFAATIKPSIPPRPTKKLSDPKLEVKADSPVSDVTGPVRLSPPLKPKPALPERAKPVIPARPTKKELKDSAEGAPLTTVLSAESAKSTQSSKSVDSVGSNQSAAAASKPKPPVPTRPVGSKIAALQGGFLSDLNKRLQVGPHAPKKEEPKAEEVVEEKEKAPLSDARKGRARGPARRAPAKVVSKPTEASPLPSKNLVLSPTLTLWEISPEDGDLIFGAEVQKVKAEEPKKVDVNAAEPVPTTTAIGAPLLSAKEVVAETAASATKEVKDLVGATEIPKVGAEAEDTLSHDAATAEVVEAEVEATGLPELSAEDKNTSNLDAAKGGDVEAKVEATELPELGAEDKITSNLDAAKGGEVDAEVKAPSGDLSTSVPATNPLEPEMKIETEEEEEKASEEVKESELDQSKVVAQGKEEDVAKLG